jgi:hypothetical protein
LADLGAAAEGLGRRFQQANDARVLSKLETDSALALDKFTSGLEEDPDSFETWEQQLKDFTQRHSNEIKQSGVNKDVYGAWERTFRDAGTRAMISVSDKARRVLVDKGITELQGNLQTMSDLAIKADSLNRPRRIAEARLLVERAQNSGYISDQTAAQLIGGFEGEVEAARFKNALNVDPEIALEALKAGDFNVSGKQKAEWTAQAKKAAKPVRIKRESQEAADAIMVTEDDPVKQQEKAMAIKDPEVRDATLTRVKSRQEQKIKTENMLRDQRADNVTEEAMDIYLGGGSREDFLDVATEIHDDGQTKKELVNLANSLYGKTGERPTTDYDKFVDAQDEINTTVAAGGELTEQYLLRKYKPYLKGPDFEQVLKYNERAIKDRAKQHVTAAKNQINNYYSRGDFGPTTGGKRSEKAKRIKAELHTGLDEWLDANPGKDPQEYVDTKIKLVAEEQMAAGLSTFWEAMIPGTQQDERLKAIAAGEHDEEILDRLIMNAGENPADFEDDIRAQMKNTPEYNELKTQLLQNIQKQ